MEWALALVALALLSVAAVSRLLSGTPITPALLFVAFGLLVGPKVLDGINLASSSATVRALAEVTLALVLFSDASRIDLGALRRTVGVPVRLLGIGLPLTIALGAVSSATVSHRFLRPGCAPRRPCWRIKRSIRHRGVWMPWRRSAFHTRRDP
jgi:NhaP-type Na+/H+ or K+/H+ antiporter